MLIDNDNPIDTDYELHTAFDDSPSSSFQYTRNTNNSNLLINTPQSI